MAHAMCVHTHSLTLARACSPTSQWPLSLACSWISISSSHMSLTLHALPKVSLNLRSSLEPHPHTTSLLRVCMARPQSGLHSTSMGLGRPRTDLMGAEHGATCHHINCLMMYVYGSVAGLFSSLTVLPVLYLSNHPMLLVFNWPGCIMPALRLTRPAYPPLNSEEHHMVARGQLHQGHWVALPKPPVRYPLQIHGHDTILHALIHSCSSLVTAPSNQGRGSSVSSLQTCILMWT